MKCLSIQQPWAYCILHGTKRVENRTWAMPQWIIDYIRQFDEGRYLIHAGKKYQTGVEREIHADSPEVSIEGMLAAPRGAIVGVVRHVDCIVPRFDATLPTDQFIWSDPHQYKFLSDDRRPFVTPIPYKGALGFFDVPNHIVKDALAAVA